MVMINSLSWLIDPSSMAFHIVILCAVGALGLALGSFKFKGVGLGVAGALFAGLLVAQLPLNLNLDILDFIRDFGLVLFVYCIGLEVGPGFLSSLRTQGSRLNLCTVGIILMGVLVSATLIVFAGLDIPLVAGLLAGATTNTPSLAAAVSSLREFPSLVDDAAQLPGLGYAVAYPFGIMGIILSMVILRLVFRIDVVQEAAVAERDVIGSHGGTLDALNVKITHQDFEGCKIRDLPLLKESKVVASRSFRNGVVSVAHGEQVVHVGDVLLLVGPKHLLQQTRDRVGRASSLDLKTVANCLSKEKLMVTKRTLVGKTLRDLAFQEKYHVTITRLERQGLEFVPHPDFRLQFGDVVWAVGQSKDLERVAQEVGNSVKVAQRPLVLPLFLGIVFGVLLGQVPFWIPGIPSPLRLGIAGGPLISALFFSRIHRIGPLVWYLPSHVNLMVRELGILLFLSSVGLKSGAHFFEIILRGDGCYWMFLATFITLVPLLVMGLVGYKLLKINYTTLCGLLAGAMTDPPALAFAEHMTQTQATTISYATVYPLTMLLRVFSIQLLLLYFLG